ncbi:unnamed protein product [Allacma fusca]|uniref:SOCS box domain-containing protein n=1 Tax=Allacma fusca TaxID=39272 RepID=A0A8J2KA42_9HEXA|nr:unnamed protein product [Allacma fusca]
MPSGCILKPLQRELADQIVRLAHPDDLRILLACGAKVNETVTQGLKPIHYAVWQRHKEAVNLLLVRGCDVNAIDETGSSALHLASERGFIDMMQILLDHGAKTDYREDLEEGVLFPRTTFCEEPLRLAIKNNHYDAARLLLERGANPNARYFFGSEINLISPVDVTFLDLLLTYGADPDSRDRSGLTPLMKACRLPHAIESVLCLISHEANVNAMTDERHDFRTVLHYAVISGSYETVSLLLKQGAAVNFPPDYQKPTPLDIAILTGDVNLVKMLIDAGANVNASSPIIGSPLHVASADNIPNRLAIMRVLLESGAEPNKMIVSDDGTALKPVLGEYLSSNEVIDKSVVALLMRHGAKVILKSQFRDPRGILNCLQNVGPQEEIMMELLEAAESFDPPMIRRCPSLTTELKSIALTKSKNPCSLKHQVRLYLWKFLGSKLPGRIDEIFLPRTLGLYLLFQMN